MADDDDDNKQPEVPEFHFDTGQLSEPLGSDAFLDVFNQLAERYPEFLRTAIETQLNYAPYMTQAQKQNQTALYRNMVRLQQEAAPQFAATQQELLAKYAPQFGQAYADQFGQLGVMESDLARMRTSATAGLEAGYTLGDELSREVEQGIRAAQTARGNYLGPAATAQEAMGKGAAAIDLYNQRYQQYGQFLDASSRSMATRQNFLQGVNPLTMGGQVGQSTGMSASYFPNQMIDAGLGANVFGTATSGAASAFGTMQQGQTSFNNSLLDAFGMNTEAGFNTYDRSYEQYLEQMAIENGLFSSPSMSSGAGSAMNIAGSAIGAVGAIGGGLLAF